MPYRRREDDIGVSSQRTRKGERHNRNSKLQNRHLDGRVSEGGGGNLWVPTGMMILRNHVRRGPLCPSRDRTGMWAQP